VLVEAVVAPADPTLVPVPPPPPPAPAAAAFACTREFG